jgi:glycosyltransferase involved in cell wall biosynthesis
MRMLTANKNLVLLACDEDPHDVDSWSNIPYLLLTHLESLGYEVVAVNLREFYVLKVLWKFTAGLFHKVFFWNTSYSYYRSLPHSLYATMVLNRAIRRFGTEACLLINTSLSHSPTRTPIPTILLGDWTYDFYIGRFLNRHPNCKEKAAIARDKAAMARASWVVSLFPCSAKRIESDYGLQNVCHLGIPVNTYPGALERFQFRDSLTERESHGDKVHGPLRIVFVGRRKYLKGLYMLLDAAALLEGQVEVAIDIIGLQRPDLDVRFKTVSNVSFHGYLGKGNAVTRDLFYSALNEADVFVSPSTPWGPYSAILEAMLQETALITYPYDEFIEMFPNCSQFALLLNEVTPEELAAKIQYLASNRPELVRLKLNARKSVVHKTWADFTQKLLQLVR